MEFKYDHDLHIHSRLSPCSGDENQTPARILEYAVENGLSTVAVTDHFWDSEIEGVSDWYKPLNIECLSKSLPLPKADGVRFLFGCETDMDINGRIGLKKENFSLFDFVIVSTTHFHMEGFTVPKNMTMTERKERYVRRFYQLLESDLPFSKLGLAHLTCNLINHASQKAHIETVDMVPDSEFYNIFRGIAAAGLGVELNLYTAWYTDDELSRVMRPYRIAKDCGCKFYFGSDSHHNTNLLNAPSKISGILAALPLEETDKFKI